MTTDCNEDLAYLVLELASESASLSSSIPDAFSHSLETIVRALNCYYSSLIEGHDTHPVDSERALKKATLARAPGLHQSKYLVFQSLCAYSPRPTNTSYQNSCHQNQD